VKSKYRALLLIVLVMVIVGVLLAVFLSGGEDEEELPIRNAVVESDPAPADEPKIVIPTVVESDPAPLVEPEVELPTGSQSDSALVEATPPSFDVVRVSPSGRAVIAGRGEPGSLVTVLQDGMALGTVKADGRGEWVLVLESNLESGDRQLSLVQDMPDGSQIMSEQIVVLSVPELQKKPVRAEGRPTSDGTTTIKLGSATTPDDDVGEGVIAVLSEREGDGPSKILQSPEVGGEGIGEETDVTIRSIDYDKDGNMTLAGRTEPEASVNLYIDDEYIGSAKANKEGDWELSPEQQVSPGKHSVRVDKVDDTGNVLARIETPISRARPEDLLLGDALVVVQPGNSLWRIARRAYGGGIYYTEIYGANRAQILDPNMIFPGQILTLPVFN